VGQVAQAIDLTAREAHSIGGRLTLTAIGALLAVAMQSSAAPIALSIVAMHGGAVGFDEAAHLVAELVDPLGDKSSVVTVIPVEVGVRHNAPHRPRWHRR
jgi:Na+/phosphate symporter